MTSRRMYPGAREEAFGYAKVEVPLGHGRSMLLYPLAVPRRPWRRWLWDATVDGRWVNSGWAWSVWQARRRARRAKPWTGGQS